MHAYARRYRLPLVVSLHGGDVTILLGPEKYQPEWWSTGRVTATLRRGLLFLSASTELKELIEGLGCPPEKVVVHRLGVDIDRFQPDLAIAKDDPRWCSWWSFRREEGHLYGIKAAARVRDAGIDCQMIIVGEGPLERRYRRAIRDFRLGDRVRLAGALPMTQVRG